MSNSEFKARGLYDFVAMGPNELSFSADEVLTITSTTAGDGWWFAKNSAGKIGVIPANYVENVADPPEPEEPPPPLSTFSNSSNLYPTTKDIINTTSTTSNLSTPPPYDHQYMNPTTFNNWQQPPEPPGWSSVAQRPHIQESTKVTATEIDKFPQVSSVVQKRAAFANCSNRISTVEYIKVEDDPDSIITNDVRKHWPSRRNQMIALDDSSRWEYYEPKTPAPELKPSDSPFRSNFELDDETLMDSSSYSDSRIERTLLLPDVHEVDAATYNQFIVEPGSNTLRTLPALARFPSSDTALRSNLRRVSVQFSNSTLIILASAERKKRPKLTTIGMMRRKGSQMSTIRSLEETPRSSARRDTDSDDSFSDSEYPSQSPQPTSSTSLPPSSASPSVNRTSMVGNETSRSAPRARFFDKHGLDNYLLNGLKGACTKTVHISFDEREGGVYWVPNTERPPFTCIIDPPSKGTKLGGLKAFMEYKIRPQFSGGSEVGRRYKQFDWLHEQLVNKFRFICIPPLPGKQIAGRFEQEFVDERRRFLELWLNRICRHPVLCASQAVKLFVTCETTDKSRKQWKSGKRNVEKDELREASWLECVDVVKTAVSESLIQSAIDTFNHQQPTLESQLKTLHQGLSKYFERHSEVYERDIQRVSELFAKVHAAVQVDKLTPGNIDVANSLSKISGSYGEIAELHNEKGTEGLRDFIERIQEYIGIISCFPSILSIQRSATDFIKTAQQRATADFSNTIHRNHVLNHVVLAEINFFQQQKVSDFKMYLKNLVDEQIQFYDKISSKLHEASMTFK